MRPALRHGARALGLLAFVGVALAAFRLLVYEPPAPAPASAPAPKETAVVELVQGEVERSLDGQWASLREGDRLSAGVEVRTGKGARTHLTVGGASRVVIDESSQVGVRELSERMHLFRLLRGRMAVDNSGAKEAPVRVEDEAGALAKGDGARFSVLSTGTAIAVASESGEVELTSARRTVRIAPGMQSVAQHGVAPAAPVPVSARVLLRVANALAAGAEASCAELQGEAPPGSQVFVDGVETRLEAGGVFRAKVPRAPDRSFVRVLLRDASGRTRTRDVPCSPRRGEIKDVAIHWGTAP